MDKQKQLEAVNLAYLLDGQINYLTGDVDALKIKLGQTAKEIDAQKNVLKNRELAVEKANKEVRESQEILRNLHSAQSSDTTILNKKQEDLAAKSEELEKLLTSLESDMIRVPLKVPVINKPVRF